MVECVQVFIIVKYVQVSLMVKYVQVSLIHYGEVRAGISMMKYVQVHVSLIHYGEARAGIPYGEVCAGNLYVLLVISLLTTFRYMYMVLLLVNFFSPAKLNYSQMILTLGCPQIDSL